MTVHPGQTAAATELSHTENPRVDHHQGDCYKDGRPSTANERPPATSSLERGAVGRCGLLVLEPSSADCGGPVLGGNNLAETEVSGGARKLQLNAMPELAAIGEIRGFCAAQVGRLWSAKSRSGLQAVVWSGTFGRAILDVHVPPG